MRTTVWTALAIPIFVAIFAVATVEAQEAENPHPIDVLLGALEPPTGTWLGMQVVDQPTPGKATSIDPSGDFVHPTGEEPGFTPDHLDIISVWVVELDPGAVELFTPTDVGALWSGVGALEVQSTDHGTFYTVTSAEVQTDDQYREGAVLFGFELAGTPPIDLPGRCEYVVWIDDSRNPGKFAADPAFPNDPAIGSNLAFGLGLSPSGGTNAHETFAIGLQEAGSFASVPSIDVRAAITPGHVMIAVPLSRIGDPAAVNFYTFCVESGLGFDPALSGADQTGLRQVGLDDLGLVVIEARDAASPATTGAQDTTPTTSRPQGQTRQTRPAPPVPTESAGAFPWWFVLMGAGLATAAPGAWLLIRDDDPCRRLRVEWEEARRALQESEAAAAAATEACEAATAQLERLETELEELCHAWPPACWASEEGASAEDPAGNRITSRDIHMRKVALGEVWTEYKAGKLSAVEVEERWREMDTPEFRQLMRDTDREYRRRRDDIDRAIAAGITELKDACAQAANEREAAATAQASADAALEAYEACGAAKGEDISTRSQNETAEVGSGATAEMVDQG